MTANTPPKPHAEGDTFTNSETGITYEFKSGAWRAVSSEAADAVVEAVAGINLQKVLDNGAVANKGMVLKTSDPNIDGSSEYDAIEIIPAGARVMISAEDGAGWKPTLELVELVPQNAGATRKAQIELDDNRLDINVDSAEDEIHFRFGDNDLLALNYTEPSQLKGKLIVEPGTSGGEAVTYGQLSTLEEEIEQIRPTFEHGQWEYSPESYAQNHKYVLIENFLEEDEQEQLCLDTYNQCRTDALNNDALSQCNRDYDTCRNAIDGSKWVTTADWTKVETIAFSSKSMDGADHSFERVEVGMLIDIFNVNDDGYMVATIDEITEGADGTGFKISLVQSKGQAGGPATVKFFSLPDGQDIELTNYVRKDGDTVTGTFVVDPQSINNTSMVVYGSAAASSNKNIFSVLNSKRQYVFSIDYFGKPSANSSYVPTVDKHLTNKKYVDDQIKNEALVGAAPARMAWKYTPNGTPKNKEVYYVPTALKVNFQPAIGGKLFYHQQGQPSWKLSPNTYFSMWEYSSSDGWIIRRTGHVTGIDFHGSGLWMDHDELGSWGDLTAGQLYYITVAGFIS